MLWFCYRMCLVEGWFSFVISCIRLVLFDSVGFSSMFIVFLCNVRLVGWICICFLISCDMFCSFSIMFFFLF